ncbi:MAG: hypothetical protein GQ569_10320 [Methylococcaceae bacterium]|nr:hypothetical protein [Methylococcaceae bacterium]
MDEDVNQKISRFVDNEMNADEAFELIKKVQLKAELKDKVTRYQVVSQALSTERVLPVKTDFLAGIQQGIANEPSYLLPVKSRPKASRQAIVAIAASIALVAVLATRMDYEKPSAEKLNTLSASAAPVIKKQTVVEKKPRTKVALYKPFKPSQEVNQNNRFNDYLQAHNASLYTNGVATFQPHVQTVSYRQD